MAARARKREADPPTQVRELAARLEQGLPRAVLLRGEERYFRDQALALVRARAERPEEGPCEVVRHDGSDPDFALARVTDDLSGGGLFAARRCVIVRDVEKFLKKGADGPSPLTRSIVAFCESPEDGGCIVLSLHTLRADHAAAKAITKAGGVTVTSRKLWDSPPPWGEPDPRRAELVQWTVARARELEVRLRPEQAVYVAAATGNDLFAIEDKLARLKDLPPGAEGEAELRSIVGWDAGVAPWGVADSLVKGDLPRSLAGIESLYRGGFEERDGRRMVDAAALSTVLVGSLQASVRRGLALASELEAGASDQEAARACGVSGAPSTVAGRLQMARARSAAGWAAMLEDVARLERGAKSRGLDENDLARVALAWKVDPRRGRGGR